MEKTALTHDENREKLCILCLKVSSKYVKTKFVKILSKGAIEAIIKSLVDYNASDQYYPNVICSGCLRKLYRFNKGLQKTIELPNLSPFDKPKNKYSRNGFCQCSLCEIVRKPMPGALTKTKTSSVTTIKGKFENYG